MYDWRVCKYVLSLANFISPSFTVLIVPNSITILIHGINNIFSLKKDYTERPSYSALFEHLFISQVNPTNCTESESEVEWADVAEFVTRILDL